MKAETANVAPRDPAATVRTETVANTVATVVIASVLVWLLFGGQSEIPALAEPPGGIFGIVPGTFNFTLLVTLVLTLVIRARVRRGVAAPVPRTAPARFAWLPANVVLRALALAAATTLLFVPATFALVWAATAAGLLPSTWSFAGMLAFFDVYFVLVALAITPAIVWRALRD